MVSVYVLRDPRTMQIRYVGISYQPKVRLAQHRGIQYGNVAPWVKELRAIGKKPLLDVLFSGLTLEQAELVERRLIFFHQSMRPGMLLNCRVIPRRIAGKFTMSQVPFCVRQQEIQCDHCSSSAIVRWTEHDERKPEFFSGGWKFLPRRQHLCPTCVESGNQPLDFFVRMERDGVLTEQASA